MGRHHNGAACRGQFLQQAQHFLHLYVVEVGGRLVGHDQFGIEHEGPGDGHPLLLAAGHGPRPPGGDVGQPHPRQQLTCPPAGLGPGAAGGPEGQGDVVHAAETRHQVEGLEDDAHAVAAVVRQLGRPHGRHRRRPHQDGPRLRAEDAGQRAEHGGLAAAARTQEERQGPRRGGEAQAVDGPEGVAARLVLDDQPVDHEGHHGPPARFPHAPGIYVRSGRHSGDHSGELSDRTLRSAAVER